MEENGFSGINTILHTLNVERVVIGRLKKRKETTLND